MTTLIFQADWITALHNLPSNSVHCVVTSPPYWGLRDYHVPGQLGLERTPAEYVAKLVEGFREVRRVLRDDGTLWLNLGDSYAAAWACARRSIVGAASPGKDTARPNRLINDLKNKDLVGVPWMVAFALRADGWYLRQDIIWAKQNPMPESVRDRCTKAHEYVFLLSKNERYFYDATAIAEPAIGENLLLRASTSKGPRVNDKWATENPQSSGETRNKRSVWNISTQPFKQAHFATFPRALVEPCILAGTSEKGCCSQCGAPWQRIVEHIPSVTNGSERRDLIDKFGQYQASGPFLQHPSQRTLGWEATCSCDRNPVAATILDPFCGAGTCGLVAARLNRNFIGIELNSVYAKMAQERITQDASLFNRVSPG